MSKRRSHIKRAKVLRGKFYSYEWVTGTCLKAMSMGCGKEYWEAIGEKMRAGRRMAQAMRGYYQD